MSITTPSNVQRTRKREKIIWTVIILTIVLSTGYSALTHYQSWQEAGKDLAEAEDVLDNVIALREVSLRWDRQDGISAELTKNKELSITAEKTELKKLEKKFEDWASLSLLSKLVFPDEEADTIYALKNRLVLRRRRLIANMFYGTPER